MRRYDPLARKSDPSPSRSVRSGRDGKPRFTREEQSEKIFWEGQSEGQVVLELAVPTTLTFPSLGILPAGPIGRPSGGLPRDAAPSTPRTGGPLGTSLYFGYCYNCMYGKCTAQQCKYLHQKPPPGTKPITPPSTADFAVEGDDEEETPRSPSPSPPDREAPGQPRPRIEGEAVTLRPTVLLRRVPLCGLLRQLPVGLHRDVSRPALAAGRKASATHCSSLVLQVEVPGGIRLFGEEPSMRMGP